MLFFLRLLRYEPFSFLFFFSFRSLNRLVVRMAMDDTKKDLYKTITTLNKVSNRIHIINLEREFEARLEGTGQGTLYEIRALAYKYSVPMRLRGRVWKILLGYMPLERAEQGAVLQAKREAYFSLVQGLEDATSGSGKGLTPAQSVVLKDIEADLPRTFLNGFEGSCMQRSVQEFIKRPLFLWAINNEMGYYQGMMDLIYTLFYAFVAEHETINGDVRTLKDLRIEALDSTFLRNVEADLYHCFGCLIKFYEVNIISVFDTHFFLVICSWLFFRTLLDQTSWLECIGTWMN